ncbi:MAG: DUF983 domain-containing protein [Planctomycetaceae bacterium]|nr:DUF983 domain-containing protein [Planctomycetaceae bacterium]
MAAPPRGLLLQRALRLDCPRCGEERMFQGLFYMKPVCGHCGLKYEREPGYFLGSIYVNYGVTAVLSAVMYITGRFRIGLSNQLLLPILLTFCIVFPVLIFRYARAWWLAMDLSFDYTDLDPESHDPTPQ